MEIYTEGEGLEDLVTCDIVKYKQMVDTRGGGLEFEQNSKAGMWAHVHI